MCNSLQKLAKYTKRCTFVNFCLRLTTFCCTHFYIISSKRHTVWPFNGLPALFQGFSMHHGLSVQICKFYRLVPFGPHFMISHQAKANKLVFVYKMITFLTIQCDNFVLSIYYIPIQPGTLSSSKSYLLLLLKGQETERYRS